MIQVRAPLVGEAQLRDIAIEVHDAVHDEVADPLEAGQIMVALFKLKRIYEVEFARFRGANVTPLDFPNAAGYWAFDGIQRYDLGKERVQQLFQIINYTDVLDKDEARYPAFTLVDEILIWHGKYYAEPPLGIGGLAYIGAWTRIYMPWDPRES